MSDDVRGARLLRGQALVEQRWPGLAARVARLTAAGCTPSLAVIGFEEDEAGRLYRARVRRVGERLGCRLVESIAPADAAMIAREIARHHADPSIHGIVVTTPLPAGVSAAVLDVIDPPRDVDGLTTISAGALYLGHECFTPSTARAILELAKAARATLVGANAVVVGRGPIVGRPSALLLLREHATVTIAHTRTRDLASVTRHADVLVVATGHAHTITREMVAPGAIVLDAGMNTVDGALVGDVDADVQQVAAFITPVPGGVGPLTGLMLWENLVSSAEIMGGHQPGAL